MKNKKAFTLLELAIALLTITIIVGAVIGGKKLVTLSNLSKARALTNSSPVAVAEDLVLWLETTSKNSFTSATPNNGDFISTWYDINPRQVVKNNATNTDANSTKPTYAANGINGLPALQFSSSLTNYMTINNTITQMGMDSGAREFFLVFNDQNTLYGSVQIGTTQDLQQNVLWSDLDNIYPLNEYDPVVAKSVVGMSNSYIVNLRVDANHNDFMSVNNSGDDVSGTTTSDIFTTNNSFYIGRTPLDSPDYFFYGKFGEIIMYNRLLTATERKDIKNYLSKKWGIPLR